MLDLRHQCASCNTCLEPLSHDPENQQPKSSGAVVMERTRSKAKKCGPSVGKTKEVVLDAEGISQISESSNKSATTSTDTKEMDDQEMELVMEKYVQKTRQCQFNAKFRR